MNLPECRLSSSVPKQVVYPTNILNRKIGKIASYEFTRMSFGLTNAPASHEMTKSKHFSKYGIGHYQKSASTHFLVHSAHFHRCHHFTSITYQRNTYLIDPASQTAVIIVLVITFTLSSNKILCISLSLLLSAKSNWEAATGFSTRAPERESFSLRRRALALGFSLKPMHSGLFNCFSRRGRLIDVDVSNLPLRRISGRPRRNGDDLRVLGGDSLCAPVWRSLLPG